MALTQAKRLTSPIKITLAEAAIAGLSQLFANRFRGYGEYPSISPKELEVAAEAGKNIILDEAIYLSPLVLVSFKKMFGGFADEFKAAAIRKWNGEKLEDTHVYSLILQHQNLADEEFDGHVAVILRHQPWYYKCLDQAIDWFSGKPPE